MDKRILNLHIQNIGRGLNRKNEWYGHNVKSLAALVGYIEELKDRVEIKNNKIQMLVARLREKESALQEEANDETYDQFSRQG